MDGLGAVLSPPRAFSRKNPRTQYETLRRALEALQGASPLNG